MALKTVNTEHFSDVEVAARELANQIEDIKSTITTANALVQSSWVGRGADAYGDLSYVIEQQVKDVSEEFWDVYDALVDAEKAFLEADQKQATSIASRNEK